MDPGQDVRGREVRARLLTRADFPFVAAAQTLGMSPSAISSWRSRFEANGGKVMKPYLIDSLRTPDRARIEFYAEVVTVYQGR